MSEHDDKAHLEGLLAASAALDDDLGTLLGKCRPNSKRSVIALALCHVAFEHAVSQRVLLEEGLTGTALALCRLQFEALVRASWTGQGATDQWVETFTAPTVSTGNIHKEPITGPPIASMLEVFGRYAPSVAAEFSILASMIPAMNSLVHGGLQIVAHSLMGGYPADKLTGVLLNRNLMQWYTGNCAVVVSQDRQLIPRMRLLREKHDGCMPRPGATQEGPQSAMAGTTSP